MQGKLVEFKPPAGFVLPEGTGAEGEFDLVSTFRMKPNGNICLVMMGDHKMPGYSDSGAKNKEGYGEYAKGMMKEMS